MAYTLATWKGDESEVMRLSVYLESWRHYKPVPICWSVCTVSMVCYHCEILYVLTFKFINTSIIFTLLLPYNLKFKIFILGGLYNLINSTFPPF